MFFSLVPTWVLNWFTFTHQLFFWRSKHQNQSNFISQHLPRLTHFPQARINTLSSMYHLTVYVYLKTVQHLFSDPSQLINFLLSSSKSQYSTYPISTAVLSCVLHEITTWILDESFLIKSTYQLYSSRRSLSLSLFIWTSSNLTLLALHNNRGSQVMMVSTSYKKYTFLNTYSYSMIFLKIDGESAFGIPKKVSRIFHVNGFFLLQFRTSCKRYVENRHLESFTWESHSVSPEHQ